MAVSTSARFYFKGDVVHVEGILNEYCDLKFLAGYQGAIKLNMVKVTDFNSMGVRRLLELLDLVGERPIEYHDVDKELLKRFCEVPALFGRNLQAVAVWRGKVKRDVRWILDNILRNQERENNFNQQAQKGTPVIDIGLV